MITIFGCRDGKLAPIQTAEGPAIWYDLLNPTPEEDKLVEAQLGVSIPTKGEMEEIELSARLYQENGAEFMTATAVLNLATDEPTKSPITFILKGSSLVTVRYAEPKAFSAFAVRAQRVDATCASGEDAMLGLIEAMIDRIADALERVSDHVDAISREVFRRKAANASKQTRNLQTIIDQIGREGDLLTMVSEGLISMVRLLAYHTAVEGGSRKSRTRGRAKTLQRDAMSLSEHAARLSSKINFLLDATLGLINLEQNQIIKIFSVASVVFLPPTLVASIYGMNFRIIPELSWTIGYPWALGLMVLSSLLPYLYFKRRGWM